MDARANALGWSLSRRACCLAAATAALLVTSVVRSATALATAAPEKTDVMFIFDTSGSMSSELGEAKEKIVEVIEASKATLPNVEFGVSNVEDIPGWNEGVFTYKLTEEQYEKDNEKPWRLDQSLTGEESKVTAAINALTIGSTGDGGTEGEYGGDGPEAYSRALWETDTNPNVGWREATRHEIVLVADNVPHDVNLNEGLPESKWLTNPFDTYEEPPGKFGIPGTVWAPGTNLRIQAVATQLATDGKPLESVEFYGAEDGYLPYWEYWAGLSGGQALNGSNGELAKELTTIITTGACSGTCTPPPPPPPHTTTTQVICNLVIATATDTCTATVADTSSSSPSNPTGTVTFTSASGGTFVAGDACTLAATPLSSNTSSCSVQFEPPSGKPLEPVITASYSGDGKHAASSGTTSYGPITSLLTYISIEELGTILAGGGSASFPVKCGFGCIIGGSLSTIPSGGKGASVSLYAEASSHRHHKAKPVLIGTGTLKLATAGKGKLIVKFTHAGRKALGKVGANGVRVTLKLTVNTLYGSTISNVTRTVRLRPAKPKHKRKK
jgi:hypothetical protein